MPLARQGSPVGLVAHPAERAHLPAGELVEGPWLVPGVAYRSGVHGEHGTLSDRLASRAWAHVGYPCVL